MSYKQEKRKIYLRDYRREWMRRRRHEFFKDKKCEKCQSTRRPELHHIDPSKKDDHKIWSWSKPRRDLELAKCQVLCWECHWRAHGRLLEDRQLLQSMRDYYEKHGKPPTYRRTGELIAGRDTYQKRFGSWNGAILAAGLSPRKSSRKEYNQENCQRAR